ncbi:tryptophan synthase beta chain [Alternaria panax]|uniref:Tryptophan synthase beta chain n=1 Tax=Alternaria panax TaxID=48097 RepID=A0AAD4FCL2_9PLEO|nr:tryptophan synthase beta chain [Alternaria panax]
MSSSNHQPDYIRKVALIGGSGQVGSHILTHLLGTSKHQVTVLTRLTSDASFPTNTNLTVAKVDYDDDDTLTEALRDQDFLIITLSARAPPTLHPRIVAAAAKAGIRWIMPNYFGYGIKDRKLGGRSELANFERFINDVEKASGVGYVALVCGFWYEFSVAMGEPWLGFRIRERSVTMYNDGKKKISLSTWDACGRAVAGLLSLPVKADDAASGNGVETWRNEAVYISSFLVSQRDILESLHRVLGTKDEDWKITYESVDKRLEDGKEDLKEGKMLGFAKALYAEVFAAELSDYETGRELDSGKIGLEKEDLDEATRRAVEMAMGPMGDIEAKFS